MRTFDLSVSEIKSAAKELSAGDKVFLSGKVYTARDAAHKRIFDMLKNSSHLPFNLENSVIYYAGPTPTPPGFAIGSCGPTTSARMDPYTPRLLELGVAATVGKGERVEAVKNAICKYNAPYFSAIGGNGALAADSVTACRVVGFEDLGCESVKELTFCRFPLIVAIDVFGGDVFSEARIKYQHIS